MDAEPMNAGVNVDLSETSGCAMHNFTGDSSDEDIVAGLLLRASAKARDGSHIPEGMYKGAWGRLLVTRVVDPEGHRAGRVFGVAGGLAREWTLTRWKGLTYSPEIKDFNGKSFRERLGGVSRDSGCLGEALFKRGEDPHFTVIRAWRESGGVLSNEHHVDLARVPAMFRFIVSEIGQSFLMGDLIEIGSECLNLHRAGEDS